MGKRFLWIVLCFTFLFSGYSQQCNETKVLNTIIYILSNEDVKKEIKNTFGRRGKLKKLHFEMAKNVTCLSIDVFDDYFEKEENLSIEDFHKEYYFEPEKNKFTYLFPKSKNSVKIHLSKPFRNYLIAELSLKDYSDSLLMLGMSIKILFVFNEKNQIQKTIIEPMINF